MSTRVSALVEQFHAANSAVIAFVEACSDDLLQMPTHGDGRQINVIAHHVAEGRLVYPALLHALLSGSPFTGFLEGTDGDPEAAWEAAHAFNAVHDAAQRDCTRDEAIAALREHGEVVGALIAALSDEDLDRSVTSPYSTVPMSGQQLIERLPIGHPQFHFVGLEVTREEWQRSRTPTSV